LQGGDHQLSALLEVGGSVVAGEFGRQGAQPGELAGRQALQAEPEEIVGFLGVVDEVLELVQDVAVQEAEEQPVGLQGVSQSPRPGSRASAPRRDARRRCLCCHTGRGSPTSGIAMASPRKRARSKGRPPTQALTATTSSMHSTPPTQRISPNCRTVRPLSHSFIPPSWRKCSHPERIPATPADPQDG
jgi:hypothetical protein